MKKNFCTMKKQYKTAIDKGINYLESKIIDGLCPSFHQLQHGPSEAWTTACIGSTLAELGIIRCDILQSLLRLQHSSGGWSYNQKVLADADTTLRVLQFFKKINFNDSKIIVPAIKFISKHQDISGGIATYTEDSLVKIGYEGEGWSTPHPCVTALALNVLPKGKVLQKASLYISQMETLKLLNPYWWKTPYYVLYEIGHSKSVVPEKDPVGISLKLLLEAKNGKVNNGLTNTLLSMQNADGSFIPSYQFRIPRPNQTMEKITGREEVVEDKNSIFSTAAAIIALQRQYNLLKF